MASSPSTLSFENRTSAPYWDTITVGREIRSYKRKDSTGPRGSVCALAPCASDVQEHRLVRALQMDVEDVDGLAVALGSPGDQRLAAGFRLDHVEHRVGGVGALFVGEIHPRVEADVDAARDDPEADMGCRRAAFAQRRRAGFDGLEREEAGL